MKHIFIAAIVVATSVPVKAQYDQRMFFNAGGGLINYGGDLQTKSFTLKQSNLTYSIGATYQFWYNFAVTASILRGKVGATDAKATTPDHVSRNLSFASNITEVSAVFEASLFDVPGEKRFTPYIYEGIAFFHMNPYTFDPSGNKVYLHPLGTEGQGLAQYGNKKQYKLLQFAIPVGIGVKYAITDNLMISGEFGFRKTFTDYMDDVSGRFYADTAVIHAARGALAAKLSFRGDELDPPLKLTTTIPRGNPENKDVYYTCLIKLSYSFRRTSMFDR
ncbi:MAG: DUF6089 family protein [Panacibacter sp.]